MPALMSAATKRRDPARFQRNLATSLKQPHLLYIHVDPTIRQLLYVGMSSGLNRPFVFCGRNPPHERRLRQLEALGVPKARIVHIVAQGLSFIQAAQFEADLITRLAPIYNGGLKP